MWEDRVIQGPDPSDALERCRLLQLAYMPLTLITAARTYVACRDPKTASPQEVRTHIVRTKLQLHEQFSFNASSEGARGGCHCPHRLVHIKRCGHGVSTAGFRA